MTDFNRVIDRKSTNDIKWRPDALAKYIGNIPVQDDFIPMWIADSDFACMPEIIKAITTRAKKEIFGYCTISKEYIQSVLYWMKANFNWEVSPSSIVVTPTVVAAINIAVNAFTNEGDGVIVQQPVYHPFMEIVNNNNRKLLNNKLINNNGHYEIDFKLLEEQASDINTKMMILCSPHNPAGRVWTIEELSKIAEICLENNVLLFSDEIHADIVFDGYKQIPFPTLGEEVAMNTIYSTSIGKTFNCPGLKISNTIIANPELKKAFEKKQQAMSLDITNTFGIEATIAAYSTQGLKWKNELISYLSENLDITQKWAEKFDNIELVRPEGTYLCWLDISKLGLSEKEILIKLLTVGNVACGTGGIFGTGGENFLRINIACPKTTLLEALSRIEKIF